jgi:hypothetical protein
MVFTLQVHQRRQMQQQAQLPKPAQQQQQQMARLDLCWTDTSSSNLSHR